MLNKFTVLILLFFAGTECFSQEKVLIDHIIANVGSDIIKDSEVENQYIQMKQQGLLTPSVTKCSILEDLLYQEILVDQAKVDSIEVSDKEIEDEINRRISYLSEQIGSIEKLEKYYNKTVFELKTEWRYLIKDQLLAQRMEGSLLNSIEVTPSDVRQFYSESPKDSLPIINTQYEILQIEVAPPISKEEEKELKASLNELRERVLKGESFSKLATLYSDDPGSSQKGGSLGFMSKAELVPEFANVAFKLKPGEVSRIVKTDFGYHIIEMIERKGDKVHVKHILKSQKVNTITLSKAKARADSIYDLLAKDSISFKNAAYRFSDDEDTRNNGGRYMNPYTGSSKFEANQIDPGTVDVIKKLTVGDISTPFLSNNLQGKQVYKIIKLVAKTESHKASLKDDYSTLKDLALEHKKNKKLEDWIKNKQASTYILIGDKYSGCPFRHVGWVK